MARISNLSEPVYYLFQPTLVVLHTIKVGFHKEQISVPFYSNAVFKTPEEASNHLPEFIQRLVAEKVISKEDVTDENTYRTGVAKLFVAELQKKEFNNDSR